ncbi:MAG: hypothetical protein KC613_05490 [Myxococcales bacterium]|nr:hypothetical protein [Myxococcales bacterium]
MTALRSRVWARIRTAPMFVLFLLAYTVVHLHFEYNFWGVGEGAIFAKYGAGDLLEVGQRVYYTKAVWCFVMIWLLAVGLSVDAALALSFGLYSILLLALFPFRIYAGLNLLLAFGMVVEVVIRRRWWADSPSSRA